VLHDGGDLGCRPVRQPPGSSRRRGSDESGHDDGSREHGETLTHVPLIGRGHTGHYPFSIEFTRITPEPTVTERQAILAALAAEDAERRAGSGWAEPLLPARGEDEEP
jgi:hypothetical protein